jgi:hypothetical protein
MINEDVLLFFSKKYEFVFDITAEILEKGPLAYYVIPRAGRFLNFWRRDFMSQYIAEIAANLDKFARSSNELGRKRCR